MPDPTHPPFVDWNMDITRTLGADGWEVARTVDGCEDFADASLGRELQADGWRVTYTPDGCQDE